MSTGRKIMVFGFVTALAAVITQTAHPEAAHAVAVLVSSGLIGLIWLRLSRKQKDGSIYVALVLFGVAIGVAVGLLIPLFTASGHLLTP